MVIAWKEGLLQIDKLSKDNHALEKSFKTLQNEGEEKITDYEKHQREWKSEKDKMRRETDDLKMELASVRAELEAVETQLKNAQTGLDAMAGDTEVSYGRTSRSRNRSANASYELPEFPDSETDRCSATGGIDQGET